MEATPYLEGKLISQIFEFETRMLVAASFHDTSYFIIDRMAGEERKMPDEKIMTEGCTDIKPLPGYHCDAFPYCITRSQFSINLLDTKNREVYCLLLDKKPEFDNEFMSLLQ